MSMINIRKKCLWCCLDSSSEVTACTANNCPLWPFRSGKYADGQKHGTRDAIGRKCMDCSSWVDSEVRDCMNTGCALWNERSVKKEKKERTPKQIEADKANGARLMAIRASKSK